MPPRRRSSLGNPPPSEAADTPVSVDREQIRRDVEEQRRKALAWKQAELEKKGTPPPVMETDNESEVAVIEPPSTISKRTRRRATMNKDESETDESVAERTRRRKTQKTNDEPVKPLVGTMTPVKEVAEPAKEKMFSSAVVQVTEDIRNTEKKRYRKKLDNDLASTVVPSEAVVPSSPLPPSSKAVESTSSDAPVAVSPKRTIEDKPLPEAPQPSTEVVEAVQYRPHLSDDDKVDYAVVVSRVLVFFAVAIMFVYYDGFAATRAVVFFMILAFLRRLHRNL